MKRIIINWIILIIILIGLGIALITQGPSLMPEPEAPVDTPYVIYYYFKTSCPACRKIDPVVDELEKEYKKCVTLKRINTGYARPKHPIRGVPTLVLETAEGKMVGSWVGAQPKSNYVKVLNKKCGG